MVDRTPSLVRAATADDTSALAHVFASLGLFEPAELVDLGEMLERYFAGAGGTGDHWLVADDNGVIGAAYYAPDNSAERMAPGIWNLYFIGVLPGRQGTGCGSALIRFVENALIADGAVELLVETSGVASFEATRSFYRKHGYDEVARVADAYKAGDDKIIFRKHLATVAATEIRRDA